MAISLPGTMKKEATALVRSGDYASEDELFAEAFRVLFEVKPHLRMTAAIGLFKEGEISLAKAAEIAGVSTVQFKDILANRGVVREIGARSPEEFGKGLDTIRRLRK